MREESEWDGKLKKAREAAGKLYEMGLDTAKIAQAVGYTVENALNGESPCQSAMISYGNY